LAPKSSLLEFGVPIKKPYLRSRYGFCYVTPPPGSAQLILITSLLEFGVPIKKPYLRSRYRVLAM
jgi:hypothetical protein